MRNRYPPIRAYPVKGFGGLDTVSPPELVAANKFVDLVDFRTENNGMLEFRERVTYYEAGVGNMPVSFCTISKGNTALTGDALVISSGRGSASNNYAYILKGIEKGIRLIARSSSPVAGNLLKINSNYPVTGAFFRDKFLCANEFTPLYPIFLDENRSTQSFEGIIPRFVFTWRARLCVFNTAQGGCQLLASSILVGDRYIGANEYTPFAGDFYELFGAKIIEVSNDSAEYGTGAIVWNGVPILATNKGLYRVDTNFGVFPITKETGVIEKTLCLYRNNVFFLGEDDVYVMDSLNSVKPLTRNTINNSVFSGDYITRDTLQQNEYIIDSYEDWNTKTQVPAGYAGGFTWSVGVTAPPDPTAVKQGGYIEVNNGAPGAGASVWGDRELITPLKLSSLYPDYGGVGGVKEHLSNFIRLDFIMSNTWDEMYSLNTLAATSDSAYNRSVGTIQFYLATRQGSSSANCAAATYTEILPNSSGYYRDNRILSFVVPIDPQANANVFDWYFQFALRLRHYLDAGSLHESNPQVHRVRISWLSAVEQGSGYLDFRQQPVLCEAKDKLWLHLSGKTINDSSMSFVMDSRGEWTKYRNLDAFSMVEVDARHEVNNEIHRRFLIGKRWQRYTSHTGHNASFYIETEEWDDLLADPNQDSSGDDYAGAIAESPKLIFDDLSQYKRLRYVQLFYEGSYDDLVKLYLWSTGYPYSPYPSVNLPWNYVPSEKMIDTIRHSANYGAWFKNKIVLLGPVPLSQRFNLSQIIYYIQTLADRPSVGQPTFSGGGTA